MKTSTKSSRADRVHCKSPYGSANKINNFTQNRVVPLHENNTAGYK